MFSTQFVEFTHRIKRLNTMSFNDLEQDEEMRNRMANNNITLCGDADDALQFPDYQNDFPF